ncbi:hypothetical protein ES705_05289 [subsurface metagenome]
MLREEKTRIVRELRNSIHKMDNLVKSKTMDIMNMWREGKIGIVDPIGKETKTEKRQKRISDERQRIGKELKKFNDAMEAETRKITSIRDVWRYFEYWEKIIGKYVNFWATDGFLLYKYLLRYPRIFEPQKNKKDTAEWFNVEGVKTANDLRRCWNFIREWRKFLFSYKKLMWGERLGGKELRIKAYYYMRHRGKELKDEGRNRKEIYEILSKEITTIFGYCPGVNYNKDGEIDTEYQTIQNASRFWHILGDKRYDKNEYKNLRVTYRERDGKKKSILLRTWYRKEKSKLAKI